MMKEVIFFTNIVLALLMMTASASKLNVPRLRLSYKGSSFSTALKKLITGLLLYFVKLKTAKFYWLITYIFFSKYLSKVIVLIVCYYMR